MSDDTVSRQRRRAAERRAAQLARRAEALAAAARRDLPGRTDLATAPGAPFASASVGPLGMLADDFEDWHDEDDDLPDGPVTRAFRDYIAGEDADDGLPDEAFESALRYRMRSRSSKTLRSNEGCWRIVMRAHAALGVRATVPMSQMRASAVLGWCSDNGYAYGTIRNVRTVIGLMHKFAGFPDPCLGGQARATLGGIARTLTTTPFHAKDAVTIEEVRDMVVLASRQRQPMKALLDVAILLILFMSAVRRCELAALRRGDADIQSLGVELRIAKSKTSQTASASVWVERSGLETCPVGALERWIEGAGVRKGPLFRHVDRSGVVHPRPVSTKYLERIAAQYAQSVGLDPTRISPHSFRAGFITEVLDRGLLSEEQIMAQTRQKSVDTLVKYFRPKHRRTQNLTMAVGL